MKNFLKNCYSNSFSQNLSNSTNKYEILGKNMFYKVKKIHEFAGIFFANYILYTIMIDYLYY